MRRSIRNTTIVALVLAGGLLIARSSDAQEAEADQTVLLTNIEFKPNRIKVAVGDRIRFINKDKFDHDVYLVRTANRNDVLLPATTIHAGQSTVVTIEQEGLFTLYCTIHGGMTGKVTTTDTFELTEEEKKRAAARHVIPPIVKVGEKLYWGRAQCHRCHMMGDRGEHQRGPNHQDLGFRAAARAQKLGLSSGTEYIVQSILEPSAHIVEGYSDDMPKVYQPPINLNKKEITALVAYLQSQGGEVDTWSINLNPQTLATKLEPSPFRHGDPQRGEHVFLEMGCGSCHTAGGRPGLSVAPDLSAIGAYRNWTWLAQSIIDPNAEVGANWHDARVYLKPGVPAPSFEETFETDEPFDDEEASDDEDSDTTGSDATITDDLARARADMEGLRARIEQLERIRQGSTPDQTGSISGTTEREQASDTSVANAPSRLSNSSTGTTPAVASQNGFDETEDLEHGDIIPGVLRKNTDEEVILLIAPERFATFTGDQVARVVVSNASRMATNYGELMTFQQLSDLISYLESLRGTPENNDAASAQPPGGRGLSAGITQREAGAQR